MILKKKSFLVKVAYGMTPEHVIPETTNLCSFFWRFAFRQVIRKRAVRRKKSGDVRKRKTGRGPSL